MKKLGFIILSTGLLVGGISFSALACSSGPDSYRQNTNQAYHYVMPTIPNNQYYGTQQHPEWFQPGRPENGYQPCVPGSNLFTRRPQPTPQWDRNVNQPPKFDRYDAPWNHQSVVPGSQRPMGQPGEPVNRDLRRDWVPGFAH